MTTHTQSLLLIAAIVACLAPTRGFAVAPTALEAEVQSLYELTITAESRLPEAEVPQAAQAILPMMQLCADANRPDLLATCYKSLLTLNAGRSGLLSTAMPRALADLQRSDPEFDEPRSLAAVLLQFAAGSDREPARTALLNIAADDTRGYVIQFALESIRNLGGSNDARVYERFIETPTLDPQIIFADRIATDLRDQRIALRAVAMMSRFPAGTFPQDLRVYPTLDEEGRLAAVSAIAAYVWSRTPAEMPPCNRDDTQICVELLVAHLGNPGVPVSDSDLQYVRNAAFALSIVATWAGEGQFDSVALELIESDLPVMRETIRSRDLHDPRIAMLDEAIDAAGRAAAHP